MLKVLDSNEECGYIVMGVEKLIESYKITGVSLTVSQAKEPIETAVKLLSDEPYLEYESLLIQGKKVFVIKLKNNIKSLQMNPQL